MTAATQTITPAQPTLAQDQPLVTILVPCLNERLVIGEFVDWCRQGLSAANVSGEVLIIDSSTDDSPAIAEEHGATVIRVPKRGLGQAYIDALPRVRGKYVILGDCDLTYDFRDLVPFLQKLNEGYEFVLGTRMHGTIEPGAMPPLHRYFGTPVTTFLLNRICHARFSDIHCGMRAMTTEALRRIDLQSSGWEYASEMVLKAARLHQKCCEVPIRFYRDREGRTSHHRRSGWLSPWRAGWVNLKAMFVFAPDRLILGPAVIALALGLILACSLSAGPYTIGPIGFDLHWMLLGVTLATVGYSGTNLALLSRAYYAFEPHWRKRVLRWYSYNRGMTIGLLLIALGFAANCALCYRWIHHGLHLSQIQYPAVFGLLLIILGWQTIAHMLILQMVMFSHPGRKEEP